MCNALLKYLSGTLVKKYAHMRWFPIFITHDLLVRDYPRLMVHFLRFLRPLRVISPQFLPHIFIQNFENVNCSKFSEHYFRHLRLLRVVNYEKRVLSFWTFRTFFSEIFDVIEWLQFRAYFESFETNLLDIFSETFEAIGCPKFMVHFWQSFRFVEHYF